MMHYLAFGTVYRHPLSGEKTTIDYPFKCYRYSKQHSVEIAKLQDGEVQFIPLNPLDDRYKKVMKWVDQRDILNRYRARCVVREEDITRILSYQQEQFNQR